MIEDQLLQEVLTTLEKLPPEWSLLPLNDKKQPAASRKKLRQGWQTESTIDREAIAQGLQAGEFHAVGIRTGPRSEVLAIDFDGPKALDIWLKLNGGEPPPFTVKWSSGKPGNFQILLRLPPGCSWEGSKNRVVLQHPDGNSQLEIRGDRHQSVLAGHHPTTGRYRWMIAPWEIEEIPQAPIWVGEFLQGLRQDAAANTQPPPPPRKRITISAPLEGVRFPARLLRHYGTPIIKLWLLARALDTADCGRATFTLATAGQLLQRSITTVRRLLAKAVRAGLIRKFTTHNGVATVYYAALDKVAAAAGLDQLGEIVELGLDDIPNVGIKATEAIAQGLQRESKFAAKLKETNNTPEGDKPRKILNPEDFWVDNDSITAEEPTVRSTGERVLMANSRYTFVSEKFVCYGGSQEAIASRRGVCERTVQRHLSKTYRERPSEVRGYRAGLDPILKRQQAQRLPRKAMQPSALRRSRDSQLFQEANRYLVIGERVKEAKCNIYYPSHTFVPYRYRRKSYKNFLSNFLPAPPDKEDKKNLSEAAIALDGEDKKNLSGGNNKIGGVEIKCVFGIYELGEGAGV